MRSSAIFLLLMAVAAANRTKTVRIGIGVSVVPFHHPLQLAEQGAMVDVLSGGRLEFGVGRGSQRYEYERLGCRWMIEAPALKRRWRVMPQLA